VPSTERRCEHAAVNGRKIGAIDELPIWMRSEAGVGKAMAPRLCETSVPAIESNFSSRSRQSMYLSENCQRRSSWSLGLESIAADTGDGLVRSDDIARRVGDGLPASLH